MPAFCAVINCGNRSNRDRKSFFRLPGNPKRACETRRYVFGIRRIKWLLALRRADLNERKIQYLRICGDHFITGKPASWQDTEHPDWVPSINMGYETNSDEPELDEFEEDTNLSSSEEGKPSTQQDTEYPDWMTFKNMGYETNLDGPALNQLLRKKRKLEVDADTSSSNKPAEDSSSKKFSTVNFVYLQKAVC